MKLSPRQRLMVKRGIETGRLVRIPTGFLKAAEGLEARGLAVLVFESGLAMPEWRLKLCEEKLPELRAAVEEDILDEGQQALGLRRRRRDGGADA